MAIFRNSGSGRKLTAWRVSGLALLLILAAAPLSRTRAQSADADTRAGNDSSVPGYAEQIKNALNEAALGNFAEAREHFRRAHALDPSARTLRGLGMVEFELSHYLESARLLAQALDSNAKPLAGKLRVETEALLQRAREYIGTVRVISEPKSAAVMVDGAVIELGLSRSTSLPVGDHVFELRAEGYLPAKRIVKVDGGETVQLDLKLVAAAESAQHPEPFVSRTRDAPAAKPLAKRWWFWLSLGVVVAAGGATAAILLTRKDREIDAYTTRNSPPMSTIKTLSVGVY
jgi:tetratricopeptide (TPR) repeat protein